MTVRSYPVRDVAGIIWTYLGPRRPTAAVPALRLDVAAAQATGDLEGRGARERYASHRGCHRLGPQLVLTPRCHSGWQARAALSSDTSPKLEVEDTDYGLRYAAIRTTNGAPDERYVRVTAYALPYAVFIPRSMDRSETGHTIFFTPVDDHNSYLYDVFYSQDGSDLDEAAMRKEMRAERGPDLDAAFSGSIGKPTIGIRIARR